jgi:hypothetical protein
VSKSTVRFTTFPRTEPPPDFIRSVIAAFQTCEPSVCSEKLAKGLTSDEVLSVIRPHLETLGFQVEAGKNKEQKIERPVYFGENGVPSLRYQIDAYHPEWRCGFEVEAGRAWMGNAVYRDLIQGLVMVQVDHLNLAVSNMYRYNSGGKPQVSTDYKNTCAVADAPRCSNCALTANCPRIGLLPSARTQAPQPFPVSEGGHAVTRGNIRS